MSEMLVVARKEFREQFRQRGDIMRYVWFAVLFGGVFPLTNLGSGRESLITGSLPWLAYAGVITASGATLGAFFVERQRGTMETLLATPLSDAAIFAGKVVFSLFISIVSVLCAVAVEIVLVNVALHLMRQPPAGLEARTFSFPGVAYFVLFVSLPAVLLYTISVGTLISLRLRNIRTANLLNFVSVFPLGLLLGLVALAVPPGLNWRYVVLATLLVMAVDPVVLRVALAFFNREAVVLNIPG